MRLSMIVFATAGASIAAEATPASTHLSPRQLPKDLNDDPILPMEGNDVDTIPELLWEGFLWNLNEFGEMLSQVTSDIFLALGWVDIVDVVDQRELLGEIQKMVENMKVVGRQYAHRTGLKYANEKNAYKEWVNTTSHWQDLIDEAKAHLDGQDVEVLDFMEVKT